MISNLVNGQIFLDLNAAGIFTIINYFCILCNIRLLLSSSSFLSVFIANSVFLLTLLTLHAEGKSLKSR